MRYVFSGCVFDTQLYTLSRAGVAIRLRPKAFHVLNYLIVHRDRVVSKDELCAHVWPGQFISDATLEGCIKVARQAIGDSGRTQRFIQSRRGYGYRFVGAVEEVPGALVEVASEDCRQATPPQNTRTVTGGAAGGEYKPVTVLCGALAEMPALVACLGPENVYRLLQAWLGLVQEVVQEYEGTLTPGTAEEMTALFGAPIAQEDHARRALLAALALRQRVQAHPALSMHGRTLTVQMGLHSGLVVTGGLGAAPQRLYTAVGEATAVARQLQQHATPGTILMSAATAVLAHGEVECTAAAPLDAPGLLAPVSVYTVQALRQRRAGVSGYGAHVVSRFVGRTQELAILRAGLTQAARGQGQVIGIVGDPGMGKSRLLAEFRQRLAGQAVTYYAGHCLPYGQALPYLPVREVLRQHWGLRETDRPEVVTATVHRGLQEAGLHPAEVAPFLLQLLDVPVDDAQLAHPSPQERRARTFRVLHQVSRHASRQQPLVLTVEDAHWIDATSEAWLATLVEQLGGLSILVLVTYRPGYRPPWLEQSMATQMALSRLTPREGLAVVQSVPQTATLPAGVRQEIITKAAGNPFFLEELAWAVRTAGPVHVSRMLPTTIQAVVAARLDRLPPAEKSLVQTAAVLGPEVHVPLLQAVADMAADDLQQHLDRLQSAEWLYETHLVPVPVYTFKHVLTQEVAYASLLQERRRALHARVVAELEMRSADWVAEQVERLADHAWRGELWEKALAYSRQAGEKALAQSAHHEAVAWFEQARAALATAVERYRAMDMTFWLSQTETVLAQVEAR